MTRILLADPDPRSQQHIASLLEQRSYALDAAADLDTALGPVREGAVDLILADLSLPGGGGMELLEQVQSSTPETSVVLLSAFGSVQDAVKAMQHGAADFLGKPVAPDQVLLAVDRALEKSALQRENRQLKSALDDRLRSLPSNQGGFCENQRRRSRGRGGQPWQALARHPWPARLAGPDGRRRK